MRRSKLLIYVDILRALARHGPLGLTHAMYEINICYRFLKQYIEFLVQEGLVEEQEQACMQKRRQNTRVVYIISERGRTVLRIFREVNSALQIIEETNDHNIAVNKRRQMILF